MTSSIVNKVNVDSIDRYMTKECETLIITDVGIFHIVCTITLWINMNKQGNIYWFKVSSKAIYYKHKSNMSYDFLKIVIWLYIQVITIMNFFSESLWQALQAIWIHVCHMTTSIINNDSHFKWKAFWYNTLNNFDYKPDTWIIWIGIPVMMINDFYMNHYDTYQELFRF